MITSRKHAGRFYLPATLSPTYYNLGHQLQTMGWQSLSLNEEADFSEDNLKFDERAAECLEYKHLLAQLVADYCPEIMPVTYLINDDNWPLVLRRLAQERYLINKQLVNQIDNLAWILKPSLLNNGQNIKIFNKLDTLEQHFSSSKRLGGEHVLQYYIEPHLLRDKRKYSIRQFLILTNYNGVYLYQDGYFNVASHPFKPQEFSDLSCHLTNEHLFGEEPNVIQIPSTQFESYPRLYPQMKKLVTSLIDSLRQRYPEAFMQDKQRTFAIFGIDFMVDNQGRIWLLEANHGPCFPTNDNHPLQTYLYHDFWQRIIEQFVLPIATNDYPGIVNSPFFAAI